MDAAGVCPSHMPQDPTPRQTTPSLSSTTTTGMADFCPYTRLKAIVYLPYTFCASVSQVTRNLLPLVLLRPGLSILCHAGLGKFFDYCLKLLQVFCLARFSQVLSGVAALNCAHKLSQQSLSGLGCRGISVMEDEGHYRDHTSGVSSTDGQWHHIAATWRSSDGTAILYDNGRQVDTPPPLRLLPRPLPLPHPVIHTEHPTSRHFSPFKLIEINEISLLTSVTLLRRPLRFKLSEANLSTLCSVTNWHHGFSFVLFVVSSKCLKMQKVTRQFLGL